MDTDVTGFRLPARETASVPTRRTTGSFRSRLRRLARAGAALLAVTVAAVTLGAPPAFAATTAVPLVTCIKPGANATYQAVFGYYLFGSSKATVPVGASNTMTPSSMNGIQPTQFSPGYQSAVFASPPVPNNQSVKWTLLGNSATATSTSTACGPSVSLPAEGNGIGPVLVLVSSVLLSIGVLYVRQWRARRRSA